MFNGVNSTTQLVVALRHNGYVLFLIHFKQTPAGLFLGRKPTRHAQGCAKNQGGKK